MAVFRFSQALVDFRFSQALVVASRYLVVFGILFGAFTVGSTVARVEHAGAQPTISAQVTPLEEESEEAPGLGVIVGTPEPGPEPEDAGDRGGFAQLTLAVMLFLAVSFIASRVIKGARAAA